ncbi:proto-oncogene Mas isoform X2 [Rhea pennata]|uniref:proto-oncogene Mas isoform X2 n=1 Tax=Rhea pennata TaxID=8795 RepID=UPI002E257503
MLSLGNDLTISIERCLSIVYPIWYRCHRSQHQSAIVCAVLWTLSFLMTVAEHLTCKDDLTNEQFDDANHCQAVLIFMWILTFMIFIPLMILSSLILVIRIHRNSLRPHSSKLYIIIVATIIVFLIFAMPMRLLYLLNYHHRSSLLGQQNHVTIVLSTVNSSINPLVYFFVGSSKKKRFKESLKVVLSRALADGLRPRSQEVGTSLDIAETIF